MNTDKKSVVLKTKAVLNIAGDLKIIFTKNNKELTGTYTASATAMGSSQYGYNLTKMGDDEYFEVGPETITCEIIGEPVVTVGEALQNTFDNTALGSSQYSCNQTKKADEDFEVGPETKTCEIIGEPEVTVGVALQKALNKNSGVKSMKPDFESNKVTLGKKTLCKIVETAYVTVIHNIRALGKILPKSAFFTDI